MSVTSDTATGTGFTAAYAWTAEVDEAPVSVSAAGDLVAVAGAGGTVRVLHAAAGAPVDVFPLSEGLLHAALSPDAQHLVVAGPGGHALWRRADRRVRRALTGERSQAAAWSGTDRVAVAAGRRAVVLRPDGTHVWTTGPGAGAVTGVAWMRGGRWLAVAAYGEVRRHERHPAAPVATYPHTGSRLALALAPTGRWICSGNRDVPLRVWRTRDGDRLALSDAPEKVSRLVFDDTGRWLAADGTPHVTVWDFSGDGPAGSRPRTLLAPAAVTALAWRPGTRAHLASGGDDGTLCLWRAAAGRAGGSLRPAHRYALGAPVVALAWSGPGLLVAATREGRIAALRLPDGTRL
ncbi:WD40 repeat domain-containing protein [Streptomyces sp. MAR4 CNX-425]|uniref:WD40 repeat domain-containing protein n=1 Tax=Streptomyces sp. MAR4 CNX-425 TaxID=3406343 RepID=UPI003B500F1D